MNGGEKERERDSMARMGVYICIYRKSSETNDRHFRLERRKVEEKTIAKGGVRLGSDCGAFRAGRRRV